jgi:D-alanyl-D-alanine dipeptidase
MVQAIISKEYRNIPIHECGEPLLPIPPDKYAFFDPPPYMSMGAEYGAVSPWMLRKGVLEALAQAQAWLQRQRPGWKIMMFDVYRPNSVQIYMVEREFGIKACDAGLDPRKLTPEQHAMLAEKVFRYWAVPSDDPTTPPLHSTGAVMDITLADETGREVDMGSPIDQGAPPAAPDYFVMATDLVGRQAHKNRQLLYNAMRAGGFHQHPGEWWHFSKGDQLWAYLERQKTHNSHIVAIYGRADLLQRKAV